MNSIASSFEGEDWLDIPESPSLPSLSLDDIINEVCHLDDETLDARLSDGVELSISPVEAPTGYKLDDVIKTKRLDSISHQLLSFRARNGFAVAIATSGSHIAVATSKGTLLLFDEEGRLERFWSNSESDGSASCVAFSEGGRYVAVGYSRGFVKIINRKTGAVEEQIKEAVQIGRGVLEVLYLDSGRTLLTLDSGGSVFEIHTRHKFRLGKSKIRCVFSGCNGEVLRMRLMPYNLLALLTVSKVLIISTHYIEEGTKSENHSGDLRVCLGRGDSLSMFRLSPQHAGISRNAVVLIHRIQLPQPVVNFGFLTKSYLVAFDEKGTCLTVHGDKCAVTESPERWRISLQFSTSDYKGLTTGGNVSPAMQCIAERACYQSVCRSRNCVIVLSHDEMFELSLLSEEDQLMQFVDRGDFVSACMYLFDIHRGRLHVDQRFKDRIPSLLAEQLRRLVDITMNGCKKGKISDLVSHYKAYISILLNICIGAQMHIFLYNEVWPRVELDPLSRLIFLESLDEFILDGSLESPPPSIVSEYITHLASEGHFSQLQASIVRFPIHCLDIDYVMSTCKQNGLYDGIIYVMNKAFGDYISPLEEMLCDVSSFAYREVLSDSEVERGNRLLLYLHCCLAGHAYPFGSLPQEQMSTVPYQIYQCITSLKGKDGISSGVSYPYLRVLLSFDAQQFTHLIRTCSDAPVFRSESRLQRMIENIGRLSMDLRYESALVHFLLLVSQLTENGSIIIPIEIVEEVVTTLMRMTWQHSSTELAIVETLQAIPQLDRKPILRMALSPMRKEICTFIYCGERKFIDLIKCYLRDMQNEIFPIIRRIFHADLSQQEFDDVSAVIFQLIPQLSIVNARECGDLVIHFFPHYLLGLPLNTVEDRRTSFPLLKAVFDIKRERQETFVQMDEDADERLFEVVFEGIVREQPKNLDDILQELLLYWLPTGSRSDFCLNLAAESECPSSTVLLMETRNRLNDAFEILFEHMNSNQGDQNRFVAWLDKCLSFCGRHAGLAHSSGWLIRIMRAVTRASVDKEDSVDMEFRLRSLAGGILERGSEHSVETCRMSSRLSLFQIWIFQRLCHIN
ncbi:hypothetical protein KIN20_019671 [Parelaphostrongylus tenuis]|uniref:Vacuolar protein sorting-associated protein 8 central domain-containing protein n=1 Tax=Parelaphostrongylus tenuis TaxID=148309 RepID=A0AAD5MLC2_PARTN|nr:hypothetical protein KIN20_019671 [Parelaphostrongylus tenuis]